MRILFFDEGDFYAQGYQDASEGFVEDVLKSFED